MTQKRLVETLSKKYKEKVRLDENGVIWIGQAKISAYAAAQLAKN